jgi:hypothetical protein
MEQTLSVEVIATRILLIRGQKVMLDRDLAHLYGVTTGVLNQSVKRNLGRFPEDFMFQLAKDESLGLISQFVISKRGGIRKLPYAFTEQGVAMLSSVLNSERAIRVNIMIMRLDTHDSKIQLIFEAIKKLLEPVPEPLAPTEPKKPPIGFRKD